MKTKKLVTLVLVAALAITSVVGGTLAYFTDEDQNTNEFAVGNIAIDLYEKVEQTDGSDKTIIAEQTLGKGTDETVGIEYNNILPGSVMTKVATVENTGANDAYVALVVKHEGYYDFNQNVDEYYEKMTADEWAALGLKGADKNAVMQEITDDIFPNWNLLYDKTKLTDPQIRYTINKLPAGGEGVKVLGVGYAQENKNGEGKDQYHYNGKYFTNGLRMTELTAGEPDFFTISDNGAHDRVWIVYLQLAPGAKFDMDLTTVCPTYFDEYSVKAFEGIALDVKAFAIQSAGFSSDEAGQKAAFAEALKPGFGF